MKRFLKSLQKLLQLMCGQVKKEDRSLEHPTSQFHLVNWNHHPAHRIPNVKVEVDFWWNNILSTRAYRSESGEKAAKSCPEGFCQSPLMCGRWGEREREKVVGKVHVWLSDADMMVKFWVEENYSHSLSWD